MGPTTKKKRQKLMEKDGRHKEFVQQRLGILIFFFSNFSFSDSRVSDRQNSSGQTRKVLYATRATREYQKQKISPRIQVNIRKIMVFSFYHIYDVLLVL